MRKYAPWILVLLLATIGLVAVSIRALQKPAALYGSVIDPAAPAPEIALQTTSGAPFQLESLRGKIVLVFFGYTNCPDVCPATLADMKFVLDQMGASRSDVAFLFITVDPERDTPERMAEFLGAFNSGFIGLTGPTGALETVYEAYDVGVSREPAAGAVGYEVAHISRIFVINQDGDLVETLPNGIGRDVILHDVQSLISEMPNSG